MMKTMTFSFDPLAFQIKLTLDNPCHREVFERMQQYKLKKMEITIVLYFNFSTCFNILSSEHLLRHSI